MNFVRKVVICVWLLQHRIWDGLRHRAICTRNRTWWLRWAAGMLLFFITDKEKAICTSAMMEYCINTSQCHRSLILKDFDNVDQIRLIKYAFYGV